MSLRPTAVLVPGQRAGRGAGRGGDGAAKFRPLARPRGVPAVRPIAPIPKPPAPKPQSQIEKRAGRDSDDSEDEEEEVEAPETRDEEEEQTGGQEDEETVDSGSASRTQSQGPTVLVAPTTVDEAPREDIRPPTPTEEEEDTGPMLPGPLRAAAYESLRRGSVEEEDSEAEGRISSPPLGASALAGGGARGGKAGRGRGRGGGRPPAAGKRRRLPAVEEEDEEESDWSDSDDDLLARLVSARARKKRGPAPSTTTTPTPTSSSTAAAGGGGRGTPANKPVATRKRPRAPAPPPEQGPSSRQRQASSGGGGDGEEEGDENEQDSGSVGSGSTMVTMASYLAEFREKPAAGMKRLSGGSSTTTKKKDSGPQPPKPPVSRAPTPPAPPTTVGPQVQLSATGEIIINMSSLEVARQDADEEGLEEVYEDPDHRATYSSFTNKTKTTRWTTEETRKFYMALRQFGTDFTTMELMFPGTRDRRQLKNKFKKEERERPDLVYRYLDSQQPLDMELFEVGLGLLESQACARVNDPPAAEAPAAEDGSTAPAGEGGEGGTAADGNGGGVEPASGEAEGGEIVEGPQEVVEA